MILRRAFRRITALAATTAALALAAGVETAAAQAPGALAAAAGADAPPAAVGGAEVSASQSAVVRQPVAARDLERGEVLTAADIRYVAAEEEGGDGDAPATLIGWTTRRMIDKGEPLREPAVSPPDLVRAGETVQAVYRGKSIVLRVTGKAAGSAAMGERVLVRVDARRRLEGVVIGPALVELDTNESR